MQRRRFLVAAGGFALATAFRSGTSGAQRPVSLADMHAHLRFKQANTMREFMTAGGMLIVAEKVIPDSGFTKWSTQRQVWEAVREAKPGELRANFDRQVAQTHQRMRAQGLPAVDSVEALDRVLKERMPAIVLGSEGADFLEGDLAYLKTMRSRGLVHLQILHYRISDIGDICTEEPRHGGLTAFGKDVVRECNRLGVLVDVAHATSAGIEQVLELSSRPVIYSHGHVAAAMPTTWSGGVPARAIHAPLARRLADKGGVLGLWPLWISYPNMNLYADELMRMADTYGPKHVGIGTDMDGLGRSTIPTYAEFAELPALLARRGLDEAGIEGIVGGNYIRVLREAMLA
jgi:membrane dipeptidase